MIKGKSRRVEGFKGCIGHLHYLLAARLGPDSRTQGLHLSKANENDDNTE